MTKVDKAARAAAKKAERDARHAKAAAEKKTALGQVETIGKQISSLVEKIKREEDAAIDAYNKHVGESTTFREQLVAKLKEAEPLCKAAGMTIKEIKAKYIGDRIGDTQFKQILSVARGAITFEKIKENERTKKQAQRAKVGTDATSRPNETPAAPRVSGPVEISTEQRQAEMAALDGGSAPPVSQAVSPPTAPTEPEPGIPEPPAEPVHVETVTEKSDRILKAAKQIDFDAMTDSDYENWKSFFFRYNTDRPKRLSKLLHKKAA